MDALPFDTTPLATVPTPQQAADMRRRLTAGEFGPSSPNWLAVPILVVFAVMLAMFASMTVTVVVPMATQFPGEEPGLFRAFPVIWITVLCAMVAIAATGLIRSFRWRNNWIRLARFADANHLRFARMTAGRGYPGLIFGLGDNRVALDHVWAPDGLLADVGTYRYTTGSGKSRSTHTYTYAAFRLPQAMPHLILDSRGNNGLGGSLPEFFRHDQRVSLGEPFDGRFTLLAPTGYGPDAFRLFPPDLMAHLIDLSPSYDLEVVDTWLFCYRRGAANTADPAFWAEIGAIMTGAAERFATLASRYRDDRWAATASAGMPTALLGVAPAGRRLRGSWVLPALILAGFLAFWLLAQQALPLLLGR